MEAGEAQAVNTPDPAQPTPDESPCSFKTYVNTRGEVVTVFNKPVTLFAMTATQARSFARALKKAATQAMTVRVKGSK